MLRIITPIPPTLKAWSTTNAGRFSTGVKAISKKPKLMAAKAINRLHSSGFFQIPGVYPVSYTHLDVYKRQHPFCVTIDQEANDYLPYLFGKDGFILIRHPEALPRQLLRLYTRLTA